MNINKIIGLSLAANGALIGINSVSVYHINFPGMVIGGAILLAGGYMVLKESL